MKKAPGYFKKLLKETIKELEYSCATLQRHNDQLVERIRKLSSRQSSKTRSYRK